MKACCYIRVSTTRQDSDNQLPAIRQWCESHDLELAEIYQESETAWRQGHQRELKRLLDDLRTGRRRYDCLVVWALDRLSRQGIGALLQLINTIELHNCHVVAVQEAWTWDTGPMREIFLAFAGWAAKFESDRKSERTLAGLAKAKANGVKLGRPTGSKDGKKRQRTGYLLRYANKGAKDGRS